MNIEFKDKVVIVTGAAHGFGRAMSRSFSELGASVWGCDILVDELQETQQLCRDAGGNCEVAEVDIRDRDAVFRFVDGVIARDKTVHILVNNAGGPLGQFGKPLEEVSQAEWDIIFEVNTRGSFYFAQAVAPSMKAQQYGRIVNISSGAGLGTSLTGIQAYASAKAGQIGLTRQLAAELGEWQITVNTIAPGFVLSNPDALEQYRRFGEERQKALVNSLSLRRVGDPQDIANGALFLASDYASWITGAVLSIDGGR